MLITGSCGIRLVVPPLVPSGVSPLASACLISSPYASTLCHAISSSRAWLRAVPLCVPRLVPLLASSSSSMSVPLPSRPIASRYPPRLIDTTDGEIRRGCGCSLGFACLLPSARHLIRAVRHRMATWLWCLPRSMSIIGAACYPLARPIRFSRRPVVLPPHRLPPRSLDTGDGAVPLGLGCLSLRFYFACCLFVLVLCIAVAGVALLA